jgi:hypothetical protein
LRGGERFFLLGRRHHVLFVGGEDAGDEFAVGGITLDDRGDAGLAALEGAVARVEAETGLAVRGIGAVAVETVFGEDGLDLAGEIHGGPGGGGGRGGDGEQRDRKGEQVGEAVHQGRNARRARSLGRPARAGVEEIFQNLF